MAAMDSGAGAGFGGNGGGGFVVQLTSGFLNPMKAVHTAPILIKWEVW